MDGNWQMTTWPYRRQWWGFTDIGPIQIPPNPFYIILTDRADGLTQWRVAFNTTTPSSDNLGYISITSAFPCNQIADGPAPGQLNPQIRPYQNCHFYDAYDEPVIGFFNPQTYARLIVRNSQLGVEILTVNNQLGVANISAPLNIINDNLTILGFNQQYDTIILSVTQPGWIAWVANVLAQTPNPAPYVPQSELGNQQLDD